MNWTFQGKEFTYDMIKDNYGFVYCINNLITNKKYIGRKYFYSVKTLPPLKGKSRKRRRLLESGWENYWGSSEYLLQDIESIGKENFSREILSLHPNKQETNYHETKLQFMLNVLEARNEDGTRMFYNNNIMTKFYPNDKQHSHRQMMHEHFTTYSRDISMKES